MKNYYSLLILIILAIIEIQVETSCANIIPPSGGLKDTLPPVLINAFPKDSDLNFKAKVITLSFDEYVQLDNQLMQTNLVVSPYPNNQPYITAHLKDVVIRLKDTLKPNTTYSINFGKALKDNNEGNAYKNFTYVFSTGNTIENGTLNGKVILAETGKIDSTLIAVLHENLNDTAIKKTRPDYFTTIDSGGNFRFKYLKNGIYNVFVLPNDYTKEYDDSAKTFAFSNEPVTIDSMPAAPLMLYAYNQYPESKNAGDFGTTPTPAPNKKKNTDSTKALKYSTSLQTKQQDLLSNLVISFAEPLAVFDSSQITLTDSNYKSVGSYTIGPDTSFRNIILQYPWKEDEYFKLVIQKNAFKDSSNRTIAKTDTISFQTNSESDYGSIRLRFSNLDLTQNPVLQFIQNDKIVDSVSLVQKEFYRKLFAPGDYDLRILYDADKNMSWTPGNYALKKQPEISVRIPRKLTIKKNWDNEVNVQL